MKEINDADFDKLVLKATTPVLVFFFADWAGPCHLIRPDVEAIAAAYDNSLKVYGVNIEDNPNAAVDWEVKGVPSLNLFHNGSLIASKVGAISGDLISEWLSSAGAI